METVTGLLEAAVRQYPASTAFIDVQTDGQVAWTYARLWDEAGRMAALLRDRGVSPGDRVMLWGRNRPHWVVAFVGSLRLGAVVVPLDVQSTRDFIGVVCNAVEPRLLVTDRALLTADVPVPHLALDDLEGMLPHYSSLNDVPTARADDLCEIVFTSGSTGAPKGVMLTHRNLASNVIAVDQLMPALSSDRLLSLLPLSHVFEQAMGLLLPLKGGACIVYPPGRVSGDTFRLLPRYQITAMLVVPQVLQLMRDGIEREVARQGRTRQWHFLHTLAARLPMRLRRLLFGQVHAKMGGHMRLLISGGARLDPELTEFWERLGIPIVQGYGMTETSPAIAGTGIAGRRTGAVGKVLPGQQVRLDDGEILVRGPNVSPGYWRNPDATTAAFKEGWFRTGDLGAFDAEGYLYLKGRAKDMIVLASGLNVHAADIEHVLLEEDAINAAAVVEVPDAEGKPTVHAVLIGPESKAEAQAAVRHANAHLLPHQRVQGFTIWPTEEFPQTTTLKIKKHEIRAWLERQGSDAAESGPDGSRDAVTRIVTDVAKVEPERVQPEMRLADDLGLDSLALVELLVAIEVDRGLTLADDQVTGSMTVAELERLIQTALPSVPPSLPDWPRARWSRGLRDALQAALLVPLVRRVTRLQWRGQEHLRGLTGPVILAPNHSSHLDTLVVLAALPGRWRRRVAVAAASDYFFRHRVAGGLVSLLLNGFPLDRQGAARASLQACRELADAGWWLLLYPEGTRSSDGHIRPFRPGIGLLATELGGATIIPVHIAGTARILPKGGRRLRLGSARVTFGPPLRFEPATGVCEATIRIEAAVRALAQGPS